MTFIDKLNSSIEKQNSLLCVGLDPVIEKIPSQFATAENPLFAFNSWIIDQTSSFVSVYKPNSAFYEGYGAKGIEQLHMTCEYIQKNHPEIPIILDAKRGDIGSTNKGYVAFAFEYLKADAITLQPYMGKEALQPFLNRKDKGCIILCRTSNPGSAEFQTLPTGNMPIYKYLAHNVVNEWNTNKNCMLVVGATYPAELTEVRKIVGDMTLLVPGIGAQGGDLEKTLKAGLTNDKKGIIINAARSIIYAEDPRKEAEKMRDEINAFRN